MKDDKDQRFKLQWYCKDCKMSIKIEHLKTHQLNGHKVEQVSYEPNFQKGEKMKKLILTLAVIITPLTLKAGDWKSSPYNWDNSPNNYENSSNKWKNSPNNWENSKQNNQRESITSESGYSYGYAVKKDDGSVNLYSNDGQRIGYTTPAEPSYPKLEYPNYEYK